MSAGVILFVAFAACLVIGVPVSISLGVASLCSVVFGGLSASSTVIAQRIFGGLQSTSIMAIAFFVLAGNLMTKGGISRRIVNFANCLVGNVRGGMSLALVLACAFFAALSGSAPATVIAIGTMLYNDMVKLGYPGDRTAGLLVVSGGLGPIIPPSIIMVIYCTLTGASVGNMFKQGMLIGIVIMLVLMAEVLFYAKKENWPKQAVKRSPSEIFKIFLDAIPALMTPIINLGGNVLCIGSKPDGTPFKVGIQKPFADRNETEAVMDITGKSVVSSGIYERCFKQNGKLYHHILNPKTGYPYDNSLISVTIISDQSVDGDALSTTCFALGLEDGLKFAEKKGVQAVLITEDYELHYTDGFQDEINVTDVES